jgi:hypothetical protein
MVHLNGTAISQAVDEITVGPVLVAFHPDVIDRLCERTMDSGHGLPAELASAILDEWNSDPEDDS